MKCRGESNSAMNCQKMRPKSETQRSIGAQTDAAGLNCASYLSFNREVGVEFVDMKYTLSTQKCFQLHVRRSFRFVVSSVESHAVCVIVSVVARHNICTGLLSCPMNPHKRMRERRTQDIFQHVPSDFLFQSPQRSANFLVAQDFPTLTINPHQTLTRVSRITGAFFFSFLAIFRFSSFLKLVNGKVS